MRAAVRQVGECPPRTYPTLRAKPCRGHRGSLPTTSTPPAITSRWDRRWPLSPSNRFSRTESEHSRYNYLCTKVCIWRIGVGAKSLVRAQLCLNGLLDVVPFYECSSIFTEVFNFFHAQEEGTPAVFSTRTSLSGLTMDDDIPVSIISIFS